MKYRLPYFTVPILSRFVRLSRQLSPAHRERYRVRLDIKKNLYADLWQSSVSVLGASIQELHGGFFRITLGDRATYIRESSVCLDNHLALRMAGNKVLVYKLLEEGGLITPPMYRSFSIKNIRPAISFLENSSDAVVVKPAAGTGAGAGVIANISTQSELARAIVQAGSFCNDMLIEEQVAGRSYRLLYLGGELIDAIERQPPCVVGNGKDSILELIRRENKLRIEARGSRATGPIDMDLEMRNYLRIQGKTIRTRPALSEVVQLKYVVNQNNAAENKRVFDSVHPSFRKLGGEVAKLLSLDLAGVDIIAADIASSPDEQVFAMNDINTKPGLHHHYLVSDDSASSDVAAQILKHIFDRQLFT